MSNQLSESAALCRDLIRAKSLSGQEDGAAEVLAGAMKRLGFDKVETDAYGNVVGTIEGGEPGPCVLLDGHIDTVPVPDASAWARAPFGGEVADGRVHGRGGLGHERGRGRHDRGRRRLSARAAPSRGGSA